MEWFAIGIPVFTTLILLLFFRERITYWEILVLMGVGGLTLGITRQVVITHQESDVEYLGAYISSVAYYEPWDEYISQTCTRQVNCRTDKDGATQCDTETYDCSYVQEHEAEWKMVDNQGATHSISEEEYKRIVTRWETRPEFVELHRDYHSQDGDKYVCTWDKKEQTLEDLTYEHIYKNKVQASHGIFKLRDVDDVTASRYKLYQYPQVSSFRQTPILAPFPLGEERDVHPYRVINALMGKKNQVRVFFLVFENQTREAATWQENLWEGGNKNELVVCVGVDSQRKIQWVHPFAWEDNPMAEIKIRDAIYQQEHLDFSTLAPVVRTSIEKYWKRKQFADFNYIEIEMSWGGLMAVYILEFIVSLGIAVWAVLNPFNPES